MAEEHCFTGVSLKRESASFFRSNRQQRRGGRTKPPRKRKKNCPLSVPKTSRKKRGSVQRPFRAPGIHRSRAACPSGFWQWPMAATRYVQKNPFGGRLVCTLLSRIAHRLRSFLGKPTGFKSSETQKWPRMLRGSWIRGKIKIKKSTSGLAPNQSITFDSGPYRRTSTCSTISTGSQKWLASVQHQAGAQIHMRTSKSGSVPASIAETSALCSEKSIFGHAWLAE